MHNYKFFASFQNSCIICLKYNTCKYEIVKNNPSQALYGYVDLNINNRVSFIQHGRTRLSQASGVMFQTPLCRTATFQSSYFNRIVKLWSCVCQDVNPDTFSSPISFKNFLKQIFRTSSFSK